MEVRPLQDPTLLASFRTTTDGDIRITMPAWRVVGIAPFPEMADANVDRNFTTGEGHWNAEITLEGYGKPITVQVHEDGAMTEYDTEKGILTHLGRLILEEATDVSSDGTTWGQLPITYEDNTFPLPANMRIVDIIFFNVLSDEKVEDVMPAQSPRRSA